MFPGNRRPVIYLDSKCQPPVFFFAGAKKSFASGKKKGIVTGKGFGRRTEKSP
jgi:hypothetical protein